MNEACPPSTIPTATTPTTSGFWGRMVRVDQPESPHLLVILVAAAALVASMVSVAVSCAKWIMAHGDLGSGACWALGLAATALAMLAGYSNHFIGVIGEQPPSGTSDEKEKG